MKSEEYTPLATPASNSSNSLNVPLVYVQPEPIQGAVITNRSVPNDAAVGFWKAGLFDCLLTIFPNAMMAWICPCVSLAQIASRLGVYGGYRNVLIGVGTLVILEHFLNGVDDWNEENEMRRNNYDREFRENRIGAYRLLSLILAMALVAFVMSMRTKIRTLFRINGTEFENFAFSLCCMSCTIAQMSTQVESYTPGECTFGPRDTLQAYASQHA